MKYIVYFLYFASIYLGKVNLDNLKKPGVRRELERRLKILFTDDLNDEMIDKF